MCGADDQQKQLEASQAAFYDEAVQQQKQTYSEDQEILGALQNSYAPIFAKGPNQEGFDAGETNNLNTQATEGTAESFNQASKALREQQAATGVEAPTGAQEQQQAELLSSAANSQAQQKQQIKQASYTQGYDEWEKAAAGLTNTAGLLNPTGYSGAATGAGNAAGQTANEIAQENNSWVNAALGAAGAIGTGVVSENPGDIFG